MINDSKKVTVFSVTRYSNSSIMENQKWRGGQLKLFAETAKAGGLLPLPQTKVCLLLRHKHHANQWSNIDTNRNQSPEELSTVIEQILAFEFDE